MGSIEVRTARLPADDEPTQPEQPATGRRRARGRQTADAPMVLDRYRLHRRLGSGAFGTVWMARDERLERDVAVKVLARERVLGGRFEREARAAARLAHPGIVTLYEAAVDDEGAYLVSELVRGTTLDSLLEAGQLSDRDVVGIAIVLCDALEHAHAQGVVHRDVKPSNVLVPETPASPSQLAKLTDFGVARVIDSEGLTNPGDVIGTLAYMAPEQAEGLDAGAPADLYSLALVIYEALSGVNPVRATTAFQRARKLGAHLPPLRRQRRDLPGELARAIDRALRPRPRERGTVADLRGALRASRPMVGDEPGIVTGAWTREDEPAADEPEPEAFSRPREPPPPDPVESAPRPVWVDRGVASVAAAGFAAWTAAHLLAPSPLPVPAAALIAAAAVLLLPRLGWLGLTLALCAGALARGHDGAALVIAIAALAPILLLPTRPGAWPLAAGAPALGLIGLAGAWPALASRAGGPVQRAMLGAIGWIWLLLAGAAGDARSDRLDLAAARRRGARTCACPVSARCARRPGTGGMDRIAGADDRPSAPRARENRRVGAGDRLGAGGADGAVGRPRAHPDPRRGAGGRLGGARPERRRSGGDRRPRDRRRRSGPHGRVRGGPRRPGGPCSAGRRQLAEGVAFPA